MLQRSFLLEDLKSSLVRQGVGQTVVVQTIADLSETEELLDLAADPGTPIVGVVGWVDLTRLDVDRQLAFLRATPGGDRLVALRHQLQVEPDPVWITRSAVRHGLVAAASVGLAYDLVASPHQLAAVHETVLALPQVRFVLDHAGNPPLAEGELSGWRSRMGRLAALPNVAVKLSGLVTVADWTSWTVGDLREAADYLLSTFGADRMMFGSDWPVCLLAAGYDEVVGAVTELISRCTVAEQMAIWAGTAIRWYRLNGVKS